MEQTTTIGVPSAPAPAATHGTGSLTLTLATGGANRTKRFGADQFRGGEHPFAQQALDGEAVEWMGIGPRAAVATDLFDDPGERLGGRDVTVDQQEGLSVVGADTDLQPGGAGRRIGGRPADLEPGDLADEHPVIAPDRRPCALDQVDELLVLDGRPTEVGIGLGEGLEQGSILDVPHRRRGSSEQRSAPGEDPGRFAGEQLEFGHALLAGPGEGGTERSLRSGLGEHPGDPGAHHRRSSRPHTGGGRRLPEMVTDQHGELDRQQPAAAGGVVGG